MPELLTEDEIAEALSHDRAAWTRDGDSLVRAVTATTFADGIELVGAVARVADELDHHPDIDIRYTTVTFRLSTHSAGGITSKDLQLASEIDRLAG